MAYAAKPHNPTSTTTLKNMVSRAAKKRNLGKEAPPALGARRTKATKKMVLRSMAELKVTEQMKNYAALKLQVRARLKAIGVPLFTTKATRGSEAFETAIQTTAVAINKLIADYMEYTFDEDLKIDSLINLGADDLGFEIWVSKWSEFLDAVDRKKKHTIKDDCDGYTAIFLMLAWAAGIPVDRLAFGVVVSETGLAEQRRRKLENMEFDHAIGLYFAFGDWWCGGDTWQQETYEWKCKVSDRHLLYMYGMMDEGFRFRYSDTYKTLKPLGEAKTRGRPDPKIFKKKSIPQ